jgi:hypothetical protein
MRGVRRGVRVSENVVALVSAAAIVAVIVLSETIWVDHRGEVRLPWQGPTVGEGAECTPPQMRACYPGPAATRDVGPCRAGTQVCMPDERWSPCDAAVLPAEETCNTDLDDDCDGDTRDCVDGPAWVRTGIPSALAAAPDGAFWRLDRESGEGDQVVRVDRVDPDKAPPPARPWNPPAEVAVAADGDLVAAVVCGGERIGRSRCALGGGALARFAPDGALRWYEPLPGVQQIGGLALAADGITLAGRVRDPFVARHDARGRPQWLQRLTSPQPLDDPDLAHAPDGGVLVWTRFRERLALAGAAFACPPDRQCALVARLAPTGDAVRWHRSFPALVISATDILADPDGGALLLGHAEGPVDLGAGEFRLPLHSTGFVVRVGPDGAPGWHRLTAGDGVHRPQCLARAGDGLALAGALTGQLRWGDVVVGAPERDIDRRDHRDVFAAFLGEDAAPRGAVRLPGWTRAALDACAGAPGGLLLLGVRRTDPPGVGDLFALRTPPARPGYAPGP